MRLVVPSQTEYYTEAERVLGMQLSRPDGDATFSDRVKAAWTVLRMDSLPHSEMCVAVSFGAAFTRFHLSVAVPLAQDLFGSADAGRQIGVWVAALNCTLSIAIGLLLGVCGDRFGFGIFVKLQLLGLVICLGTCWTRSWVAAVTAVASNIGYTSVEYMVSGIAWFIHFSPPNRIGMVTSVFNLFSTVMLLILQILMTSASQMMPEGLSRYVEPLVVSGLLACGTAGYFCIRFITVNPFPATQRLLQRDDLQHN